MAQICNSSMVFFTCILLAILVSISAHGHHKHNGPAPAPAPAKSPSPSFAPALSPTHNGGAALSVPGILIGGLSMMFFHIFWN
ncbi:unnamed protein product [Amaranthus hypochondriacus]